MREIFEKELKELEEKERGIGTIFELLEEDSTKSSFEGETKSDHEARTLMH